MWFSKDGKSVTVANTEPLPITSPVTNVRVGFEDAIASGVDGIEAILMRLGSGMTCSQTSGSLVVGAGTAANSETLVRLLDPVNPSKLFTFTGRFKAVWGLTLSQRIVNQEVAVEFVDLVASQVAATVLSTTSVAVTLSPMPFAVKHIGQKMYLGNLLGISAQTQYATLATVVGNVATFTVAGYPASGSGTLDIWGWNHYSVIYDGTSATAAKFQNAARGYAFGPTSATISTTATAGSHVPYLSPDGMEAVFGEKPGASVTLGALTQRASSMRNLPHEHTKLICQIRVTNYSTAPASATTVTVNFINIDTTPYVNAVIAGVGQMSKVSPLPVELAMSSAGVALASGSTTIGRVLSAAGSSAITGASVKASAGRLYGATVTNHAATTRYVHVYSKASAATLGTDTPLHSIGLQAGQTTVFDSAVGINMALGIAWAATTDNVAIPVTAATAGDVSISLRYA